jgi:hypothetical protein
MINRVGPTASIVSLAQAAFCAMAQGFPVSSANLGDSKPRSRIEQ